MRSRVLLAMFRVCVTLSVIFSLGRSQVTYTCTDGYEYDDTRHACKDIDECVALPDACKGGMKCVNHFGGYLCLPNNAEIFISTAEDEEGAGPGDAPEPLPPAPDPAPQPGSGPAPGSGPGAGSEAGSSRRATTGTGPAPAPLPRQQPAPSGGINCALVPYLCQYQCVNQAGVYGCVCPEGYQLQADRLCEDRNECEEGHYCSADQLCWNYHGGYRCFPRNPCRPPYTAIAEGRCACRSDVPACRGLPSSMVYKYMSITSGRTLPADLFQVASTDASSSMIHTFSIASGNDRQEFYLRTISGRSAMLVMTRPLQGPREAVVDIEMHTHNTALNYRSSAILRLTIVIGAYPF